MPGRDFTGRITRPPWQTVAHADQGLLPNGSVLWAGEKVRVDGRRGTWQVVSCCYQPATDSHVFWVRNDDGSIPAEADKIRKAR